MADVDIWILCSQSQINIFLRLSMSYIFSQMDVRVKTIIIQIFVFFWHWRLADVSKKKKIERIFPIRGHSFKAWDFVTVKRKIRRQDRIYTHDNYIEIIQKSSSTNTFSVEKIKTEDIIDYKKWWPDFYKKNVLSIKSHGKNVPRAQKVTFKISDYFYFIYDSSEPGILIVHPYIDNFISEHFSLVKPHQFVQICRTS